MFSVATADFRNKQTITVYGGGSYYVYYKVTAANALQKCESSSGIGGPYVCATICASYFFGCGPSPYYALNNEGLYYRYPSFYSASSGADTAYFPWQ